MVAGAAQRSSASVADFHRLSVSPLPFGASLGAIVLVDGAEVCFVREDQKSDCKSSRFVTSLPTVC